MAQDVDLKSIERNLIEGSNPSPPTIIKMLGPYLRRDGRKHVIVYWDDGRQQTVSWPRIVWMLAGRKINQSDTIDHVNNDHTDDRLENLQLLSREDNIKKASRPAGTFTFVCPMCKQQATKFMRNVRHNWKMEKSGPYCSKSCAGKVRPYKK